jgi:hypothetical protein
MRVFPPGHAWQAVQTMEWVPWSLDLRDRTESFMRERKRLGFSGTGWYQLGWFDDNSQAALLPFSALASRIRYEVWEEIGWIWEKSKATTTLFGAIKCEPST